MLVKLKKNKTKPTSKKETKNPTKPLRLGIFKGYLQKSLLQYGNELKNRNHLTSFTNHEYVSMPLNERRTETDIVFVQFIKRKTIYQEVFFSTLKLKLYADVGKSRPCTNSAA